MGGYMTAADLFHDWREDVFSGKGPVLFPVADPGDDLNRIELGPGLVTLLGGAPGAGKSALAMQLVVEALARTPALKALVGNVEMPPSTLLDRQLARLSGIPLDLIRHRRLTAEHGADLARGLDALEAIADRLAFLNPPFDLMNVASAADDHGAALIVLDYTQRFNTVGKHIDKRAGTDALMGDVRQFADAGVAVLLVSALGRQKDDKGRSGYAAGSMSLASFRESSELEFGCDSAFILVGDPDDAGRAVLLHLKNRNGETRDVHLAFDKPRQRFTATTAPTVQPKPSKGERGKLADSLRVLWTNSPTATEDDA